MRIQYSALLDSSSDDLHVESSEKRGSSGRGSTNFGYTISLLLLLSVGLNIVLLLKFWEHPPDSDCSISGPPELSLYSPANDAVSHKIVKFHRGYGSDTPVYEMPPSPEVDAAWANLTTKIVAGISRNEAQMMENRTYPILDHDGQYMIVLNMYHLLHCLNVLRILVHPDDYPGWAEEKKITMWHVRHCIGSLRQSIMCSADITPVVFQWSERLGLALSRTDVNHVCRDFEKIGEWGNNHRFEGIEDTDLTVHLPDGLDD